jgi:DUF1009 family protein
MSKLGILAGGGELPSMLMQACRERGWPFHVVAFRDQADAATVAGVPHDWVRLGEAAKLAEALHAAGVDRVVMCGKVHRPSLSALMPDWRGVKFLARIGGRLLSDNRLMEAIVKEFEAEGFAVIGAADVARSLLARPGPYGRLTPTTEEATSIVAGFAAARRAGRRDIGQSAVVQGSTILDVEGPEGTDGLIERCAARQQEMRADPPVIGMLTVRKAAAARFRGIAVEAGGVLVLDGRALGEATDAAGMFLIGTDVAP